MNFTFTLSGMDVFNCAARISRWYIMILTCLIDQGKQDLACSYVTRGLSIGLNDFEHESCDHLSDLWHFLPSFCIAFYHLWSMTVTSCNLNTYQRSAHCPVTLKSTIREYWILDHRSEQRQNILWSSIIYTHYCLYKLQSPISINYNLLHSEPSSFWQRAMVNDSRQNISLGHWSLQSALISTRSLV